MCQNISEKSGRVCKSVSRAAGAGPMTWPPCGTFRRLAAFHGGEPVGTSCHDNRPYSCRHGPRRLRGRSCFRDLANRLHDKAARIRAQRAALPQYERKGHVRAFCATTKRFCEQHVRKLSPQEKLITPCRPDLETVICWPDRFGTLAPLGQPVTPGVPFEDITYPCKRIPAGLCRGAFCLRRPDAFSGCPAPVSTNTEKLRKLQVHHLDDPCINRRT
jgi:hypothetical protein